jgi:hypothetical protein
LIPGVAVGERRAVADGRDLLVAYVSTRQHTSAYVGIRQHTSAYVCIRQHTSAYVCIRQHAWCGWRWRISGRIREHT